MNYTKILRTALMAVLLFTAVNIFLTEKSDARQKRLADELIRFHVRANSDSEDDQRLKLKVKEAVVTYMNEFLDESESAARSAELIEENMLEIAELASAVIHEEGYTYDVRAYMLKEYFPLKVYGDIALFPGEYTAFRIDIGDASGKNWWCVLYPPLCFVDITHGVIEEGNDDFCRYEAEFKYLKFLNKYME